MAGNLHWNFKPSRDFRGEWRGYFAEYTRALAEVKREADLQLTDEEEEENVTMRNYSRGSVVIHRHSITVDQLPRTVQDVTVLLHGTIKAQHSRTNHIGNVFKTGKKAGEKRPDKTMDHYAIGLVSNNPLTAVWSDGKLQYAKGYLNGELFWTESVNELKAKIKGGWDG